MEVIGYIGKKVDIVYKDGAKYAGYIFEYSQAEDSDIGEESFTLAPLGETVQLELPVEGIEKIEQDLNYMSFEIDGTLQ